MGHAKVLTKDVFCFNMGITIQTAKTLYFTIAFSLPSIILGAPDYHFKCFKEIMPQGWALCQSFITTIPGN